MKKIINTNKWKIPLYKIYTDKEDVKAVAQVIRRGMDWAIGDRKSTRLNSSHIQKSRMPSSA